jgi:TusA-related sulfurtransferase
MKQLLLVMAAATGVFAQQAAPPTQHEGMDPKSCPMHAEHMKAQAGADDQRFAAMNARGDRSMGFEQSKTAHHFRTLEDGGAIEVTVNDPSDTTNLTAIRNHLAQIAKQFAAGDFSAPMMTHAEMPPGATEMQKLKDKIAYTYEELPSGARVKITTGDPKALAAVHDFFDYQIKEHRTGDAPAVHQH